jgi:hypothetical protein
MKTVLIHASVLELILPEYFSWNPELPWKEVWILLLKRFHRKNDMLGPAGPVIPVDTRQVRRKPP